ncbi:MAG TPA: hypothetical protein VI386_12885, partial [Candidatus Sulfotelmatobacter sp.]
TRDCCPAGLIHSAQSGLTIVQGVFNMAAAASKSPKIMEGSVPHCNRGKQNEYCLPCSKLVCSVPHMN